MPGGTERIFQATANLEESEFADILLPFAQLSPVVEGRAEARQPAEVGCIDAEYVDVDSCAEGGA